MVFMHNASIFVLISYIIGVKHYSGNHTVASRDHAEAQEFEFK